MALTRMATLTILFMLITVLGVALLIGPMEIAVRGEMDHGLG